MDWPNSAGPMSVSFCHPCAAMTIPTTSLSSTGHAGASLGATGIESECIASTFGSDRSWAHGRRPAARCRNPSARASGQGRGRTWPCALDDDPGSTPPPPTEGEPSAPGCHVAAGASTGTPAPHSSRTRSLRGHHPPPRPDRCDTRRGPVIGRPLDRCDSRGGCRPDGWRAGRGPARAEGRLREVTERPVSHVGPP